MKKTIITCAIIGSMILFEATVFANGNESKKIKKARVMELTKFTVNDFLASKDSLSVDEGLRQLQKSEANNNEIGTSEKSSGVVTE